MELAVSEAKRARDRGDYPIGAVITRVTKAGEVVIASAGNRVKTSGSSIKHVELETLKYVSSGYGRYLPDFVLYSTHEPLPSLAASAGPRSTSGGRVSSPDGSFSRRAITRSRSSAVISEWNAGSCSATGSLVPGRIRRRRGPDRINEGMVRSEPAIARRARRRRFREPVRRGSPERPRGGSP